MNRTGDQTCFLFSCRDRDSVSNFAQAYSEAIQDKEKILSILRINPGATRGGLSQRGIDYQLGYVDTLKRTCTA
jgi:hypothetical protein